MIDPISRSWTALRRIAGILSRAWTTLRRIAGILSRAWTTLRRIAGRSRSARITFAAAAISYYAFLSSIPILVFGVTLALLLGAVSNAVIADAA